MLANNFKIWSKESIITQTIFVSLFYFNKFFEIKCFTEIATNYKLAHHY